jgi:copper chaperone CopZ
MKAKQAGILAVILGSTCCIGPLLLVAVGVGGGAVFIGRYHWFFIIAALAALTWAWAKYLREKTVCDCQHKAMRGQRTAILTLLITTALVIGFAGLNISRYVFATTPAAVQTQTPLANGLNRIVLSVEGLSCVTCEIPVRHALRRIDGVESAHVSAATKTATVDYEPAKTNPEQLVAAINSTGYRATLPNKVNDSAFMTRNKNTNVTKAELASTSGGENAAATTANGISVFKVPLVCPAAPQIGCGSASKPILLDLERQAGVLEAWLNRAGTIIAVVWKSDSNSETRRNVAAELKEDHAVEMQAKSRDEAVKDFLSGKGWYRGADVGRLSEEEAGIIAARLVRFARAKTVLAKDKAEGLQRAIEDTLRKDLTGKSTGSNRLEDVAREYLDQEQIKILKEAIKDEVAIENGERPMPKEG